MNIPDDAFFTLLEQALRGKGSETLQRTLYQQLREAILQGTLAGDSRLPGSRAMAQHLGLSRNTINSALEQLAIEGYLLRSRQGTYVAPLRSQGEGDIEARVIVLPEYLQGLPAAIHPRCSLRRECLRLITFHFPSGVDCSIGYCAKRPAHYWATAMRRESSYCEKPLPGTSRSPGGSAAKPARL